MNTNSKRLETTPIPEERSGEEYEADERFKTKVPSLVLESETVDLKKHPLSSRLGFSSEGVQLSQKITDYNFNHYTNQ